jgi:hypothetical protein
LRTLAHQKRVLCMAQEEVSTITSLLLCNCFICSCLDRCVSYILSLPHQFLGSANREEVD